MAVFEPERCYSCKRLFCCEDCCVNHIKNKHPGRESHCPLCRYEPLIVRNFEHQQLLCHVVFNHLPLHCRVCGELFENVEDLKTIGKCGRHPLITVEPPTFIELLKSTSSTNTPSPLNRTPYQPSSIDRNGMSIGGDYNCNFDNFTSPPELSRGTSTPMHIGIMRRNYNLQYQTIPKTPNVIPTTPSFSIENDSKKSNVSVGTPKSNSNEGESVYHSGQSSMKSESSQNTPLRSILSMKSASSEIQQHDFSKKMSDRKLPSMEELDEDVIDMELTDAVGAIYTENVTPPVNGNVSKHKELKDSGKKVRFIDQLDIKTELDNKFDVSEVEEFFEARQSFSDMSLVLAEDLNVNNSSVQIFNVENQKNIVKKITDDDGNENKERKRNENVETIKNQAAKSESTSRVVMMVLVEQTGGSESTDLGPLIDSSLKKLGSVLSKSASLQNDSAGLIDDKAKNGGKISMVSVDSYTSVSTVECFKAPDTEKVPQTNRSMTPNINLTGGGIFAAVANAVKNAFRNLSGVTLTKNPTVESTASQEMPQILSIPLPNTSEKTSGISANSTMNSSSRPGKRSRDEVDSIILELPEVSDIQTERSNNHNDVRSPLQKRPRGWYGQIRGREPIARMKNAFSSPRGISSERQCFQQGSLTVRDTVVPLPSRAHQSTQTE